MSEKKVPQDASEMEPSALFSLYSKAPFPHELVSLPVGEKFPFAAALPQIAMVPINVEESFRCTAEAQDSANLFLAKHPPKEGDKSLAYDMIFETARTVNVLWRACRDPRDPKLEKRVFPTPAAMRMSLTLDQISVLSQSYLRVERICSPIRSIMTEEERDAFLDRLREGGRKAAPLDYISSELLRELLLHSVSRPSELQSPSSSSGSPPDESTSPGSDRAPEELPPVLVSEELGLGSLPPAEKDPVLVFDPPKATNLAMDPPEKKKGK